MVVDMRFDAPANAVESGILELASHIHSWYIRVEATAANVVGMVGSDNHAMDSAHKHQPAVKSLHVDELHELVTPPPDRTKMVDDSSSVVRKAGNRSILKTNSSHRSHFPARHVRWDPRPDYKSCSKPVSLSCKKIFEHISGSKGCPKSFK